MSFESVYRSRQGVIELTKVADFIGSLVIKNEYEARKAETSESLYEYIKYHGAYTATDSFSDYTLEDRTNYKSTVYIYIMSVIRDYEFSEAILNTITNYRTSTLDKMLENKDKLIIDYLKGLRIARIYFYKEQNLYYRQFLGKAPPSEEKIYVINKDIGLEGYTEITDLSIPPNPKIVYYRKDEQTIENNFISLGFIDSWTRINDNGEEEYIADKFYYLNYMNVEDIHKTKTSLTYSYYILQNHIEEIIKKYPNKYFLRFVGTDITPFYLRSLENYSIIKYDETILSSTELFYFFKAYDKAKKHVVMDYISGFDSKQPLYNLLMIQNLLYYTVINYSNSYIERYSVGIYTKENCDDILNSYGYNSLTKISDINIKQRIVRNLNELISNKGNNYVLEIIMNKILQDPNSELKRYYLEKKYNTGDDASIEIDTTQGLENSVSLVFREVPALSINELSTTSDSYRDYDEFVDSDDMWGGITQDDNLTQKQTKKELIKKKLLSSNFGSILTKYITLTRTIDVQESQRTLRDLVYMMLKTLYDNDADEFFEIKMNFDSYTVTPAGLFAALCWTQQMKNSKNCVGNPDIVHQSTNGFSNEGHRHVEDVVLQRRFDDSDIICTDECVITSSVVFRKMGLLSVDINELENNIIIINGKPVKVMDISPEIASWKVVDFIKENPDLFEALLEDVDIEGKYIPTTRLVDMRDSSGRLSEKGILTMENSPKDGIKHLTDYTEQIDDFLVHFRYYSEGRQLGEVNKNTTFAELVMDYKNQYPNLIEKITKKLQKSYDFREFQAWQYMLQQSRTNNSINFIFKGYTKFSEYIDHVKSSGLIEFINKNIPLHNGMIYLSDVLYVQNALNDAFKTWVTDSFSPLIYSGNESASGGETTIQSDDSFINDMKLLFDEFLSVFSQLYSINYNYSFGGDQGGMYLQLFYNPLMSHYTDGYKDRLNLGEGYSSIYKTSCEDKIKLKHSYSSMNEDSFYDAINNDVIYDRETNEYNVDDPLTYENSFNMKQSFVGNLGFNESIATHSKYQISDNLGMYGILKIKSSSGEKVYYEKDS